MHNTEPAIDVIMPAFNAGKFLQAAINSVLRQTFKNFKLYIINDGSTDNTQEIADRALISDNRIIIHNNDRNLGIIATLNKAIGISSSPLIARMDSDDLMHPRRLEEQFAFLEKNPDYVLCGTSILKFKKYPWRKYFKKKGQFIDDPCFRVQMLRNPPLAHPTAMFKRSALNNNAPYKSSKLHAEDYQLWADLLVKGKAAVLGDTLLYYRTHSNQITKTHSSTMISTANDIKLNSLRGLGFKLRDADIKLYLSLMSGHPIAATNIRAYQSIIDDLKSQSARLKTTNSKLLEELFQAQLMKIAKHI